MNDKFDTARKWFTLAFLMRQRLGDVLERGRNQYGVAGSLISSGFYPHWPEEVKQKIRRLNRAANRLDAAGFKARPKRVQLNTMRNLRLDSHTNEIRSQHGSLTR